MYTLTPAINIPRQPAKSWEPGDEANLYLCVDMYLPTVLYMTKVAPITTPVDMTATYQLVYN